MKAAQTHPPTGPPGVVGRPPRAGNARGFTLVETLVVIAILALLAAILLPSLARARLRSRVVVVHSDLRQITLALESYAMEQKDQFPPTRQSCGTDILYQLPVELAHKRYLPTSPDAQIRSFMEDLFNSGLTYRYRAPGAVWQNGVLMDFPDSTWRPRAKIWVPNDVPHCEDDQGRYYADRTGEPPSPVSYAVWSLGPEPDCPRFPRWEDGTLNQTKMPLLREYWLTPTHSTAGLITHFRMKKGVMHMSP
jgi:prepilin-type N-terminal cleavage/methylation domain-containing protein